jgi:hypothetical protein
VLARSSHAGGAGWLGRVTDGWRLSICWQLHVRRGSEDE